jgi:hypothetical protein
LQEPTAWKPGLLQRPWALAAAMLGPLLIGIGILLWLLFRQHPGIPIK